MLIFVMATAMLGGCGNGSGAEHRAMDERIHIQLGQSGDDILKNYPGLFSMSDHPSGAKFYAARWTKDARGTVEIGPSETLFVIHHVLSATGNYSPSFANENIIEWNINAGLAESSLIMHDDARKQFQSIRANLRKASWHRYIDPDAPPPVGCKRTTLCRILVLHLWTGYGLRANPGRMDASSRAHALETLEQGGLPDDRLVPRSSSERRQPAGCLLH
ncbi:hypothetical protein [Herbaspirillum huttiense]|uniref:Uncharacterized protein n=1 Tax=Herbaspirillum huttiense subsp. lycopersici TaxID=3074428 RepID=A0ABU2EQZ3_9BURK|nr:hypothetical protein [Herbaspirillum huttiense]MDR9850177.1 hypothetical protein [Herbaspirillum huttiense SE1]